MGDVKATAVAAYEKLGGANDQIAQVTPYAKDFFEALHAGREPTGFAANIAGKLDFLDKAAKASEYSELIKSAFDEHERRGELVLSAGIKIGTTIGEKLLGRSIETHPYFALAKPGLDLLGKALTARVKYDDILANYDKAAQIAGQNIAEIQFVSIRSRCQLLTQRYDLYWDHLGKLSDLLTPKSEKEKLAREMRTLGPIRFSASMQTLKDVRIEWAGVAFDAFTMAIFLANEAKLAKACINKANKLLADMKSSSNINKVAGYAAQQEMQWRQFEAMQANKPTVQVLDPAKFSKARSERAYRWSKAIGQMCDYVRTEGILHKYQHDEEVEKLRAALG